MSYEGRAKNERSGLSHVINPLHPDQTLCGFVMTNWHGRLTWPWKQVEDGSHVHCSRCQKGLRIRQSRKAHPVTEEAR